MRKLGAMLALIAAVGMINAESGQAQKRSHDQKFVGRLGDLKGVRVSLAFEAHFELPATRQIGAS